MNLSHILGKHVKVQGKVFHIRFLFLVLIFMAEKISPHNHCHMCMKAIPVGEKLCSEECRQKYTTLTKRRRIIWLFLWAIIVGSIIVLMLVQTP